MEPRTAGLMGLVMSDALDLDSKSSAESVFSASLRTTCINGAQISPDAFVLLKHNWTDVNR